MKRANVNVGSTVEAYPVSAWSRIPEGISLESLWQLCGPQVERHMQNLPLWKVFALVYFEGVAHGSGAERERIAKAAEIDRLRAALLVMRGRLLLENPHAVTTEADELLTPQPKE